MLLKKTKYPNSHERVFPIFFIYIVYIKCSLCENLKKSVLVKVRTFVKYPFSSLNCEDYSLREWIEKLCL